MADDVYKPEFTKMRQSPIYKMYQGYLQRQLGRGGIDAEQQARQAAGEGIAGNLRANERAARMSGAQAFGNNSGGQLPALISSIRSQAPFGAANLAGQQAGENSMIRSGQAGMSAKQSLANTYATLFNPWFRNELMQQQNAMALAAMGGGEGGGFDMGGALSGAATGFATGNIPGAIVGGVAGGASGML